MGNASVSRLGLLMDTLGISGRELAEVLHVDYSLVSKWRNRRRLLSLHSAYLKDIADYLLAIERRKSLNIIYGLIQAYDPKVSLENRPAIVALLQRWLVDGGPLTSVPENERMLDQLDRDCYDASVRIWSDNSGRRQAVLDFLDFVLTLPPGQQLLLVSQEDMSWMVEDASFLQQWQAKLTQIVQHKHKIRIIHWVDRNTSSLVGILNYWLPLHLTGAIESWFFPKYSDLPYRLTLFMVQKALALVGIASQNEDSKRHTAMYSDPFSLHHYETVFQTLVEECRPLVKTFAPGQYLEMIDHAFARGTLADTYCVTSLPTVASMSPELLDLILQENNIRGEQAAQVLDYHKAVSIHLSEPEHHFFLRNMLELDKVRAASFQSRVANRELSALIGTPIMINQELFRRHLQEVVSSLRQHSCFEVALIPRSQRSDGINIWAYDNKVVTAWSERPELPYGTCASELTVVNAFFEHFDTLWDSISRVIRDKERVIAELCSIIES